MSSDSSADGGLAGLGHSVVRASRLGNLRPRIRHVFLGPDEEIPQSDERTPLLQENSDNPGDRESGPRGLAPLRSLLDPASQRRVDYMTKQREETAKQQQQQADDDDAAAADDSEEQVLSAKIQREDGTEAEVIIGQSTLPQVVFNSNNVLIGIGILSLPLAFRYTGWLLGLTGLLVSACATKYTAGLLAKCMDVDRSLANFSDIAYVAFGARGRALTAVLITGELMIAQIGLIIILADTLASHVDLLSATAWKVVAGIVLLPLQFVPMRWLGLTSGLGILSSVAILLVAFVAGFLKPEAPGSLRAVAPTAVLPPNWRALPLSFGLIMSLWTAHCTFPNIYRDMRQPAKYGKGLNYIFSSVTIIDLLVAVVGYLLFGDSATDEFTRNIIQTKEYPSAVRLTVVVLIIIVPVTKFPLQAAPIVSTLEVLSGIDPRAKLLHPNRVNRSRVLTWLCKSAFRTLVVVLAVVVAILVPSFEVIAGVVGGFFGYLICLILPLVFHLKMFDKQIRGWRRLLDLAMIGIAIVLGVVGTAWEFLPRAWVGVA